MGSNRRSGARSCAPEKTLECAENDPYGDGDGEKQDGYNRGRDYRVLRRQPCKRNRQRVFTETQSDVGERLGRRRHGGANRHLSAMGGKRDGAAEKSGKKLRRGRKILRRAVGEQRSDGDADECVQRIPEEVEERNFVGEKFCGEQRSSYNDYWPGVEGVQRRRELKKSQMREQAEGRDRSIDVQPGSKTCSGYDR